MSAEILRRAAASMREAADSNTCCCNDTDCDDNWYANFLTSVADWLNTEAQIEERTRLAITFDGAPMFGVSHPALAVAHAYLGSAS